MAPHDGLITIGSMFQYRHIGELLIFSFCLIMIQIKTRAVYIWISSNIVALWGSIFTLQYIDAGGQSTNALGGAIILLASALKAFSFADRSLLRKHNKIPTLLLFSGIIISFVIFSLGETDFRIFLVTISGIFFLQLFYTCWLIKNGPALASVKYCVSVLSTFIASLVFLLANAFPLGSKTRFIPSDSSIPYHVIILAVLIFLFHMAFIGLIIGRQTRENLLQLRKTTRAREVINQSRSRERESAVLADERYHLIKMLTHEVRQPMNSAQAALQALSYKISSGSETPEYVKETIENAGSTLNSIVLSISNSILGATLITKGRVQNLEVTDICCVVDLAMLDIDRIEAQRFEKKFDQPVLFADADPVILRLGVRNLLENAVKYSPRNSKIFLNVHIDDEHLTLVISVKNEIEGSAMLAPDIFNQARRGVDKKYEGFGLGLYIAKEVAKMHKGSLGCYQSNDKTVTFELPFQPNRETS